MGIQAWFIILGVAVMTLIVWDGKRSRHVQRTAGLTDRSAHSSNATPSSTLDEPLNGLTPMSAVATPDAVAASEHPLQGSRIGSATHIAGRIIADEPVLIKGSITGKVIAPNHLVSVTATGYVTSYVEGSRVEVDGQVVGTLKANSRATLLSRARMQGVIESPRLACMSGAWLRVEVAKTSSRQRKVARAS